jgi:hypothetical protein
VRILVFAADLGPLPARVWLQVERPEPVRAEHRSRLAVLGLDFTVGDGVQVLDAGLLDRVIGVAGGLPGLYPLKGHPSARRISRSPSMLMSSTTPSATKKVGQFGRAPGTERQAVLGRLDLAIFFTSRRYGSVKVGGRPPLYLGYSESNPSMLKLWIRSRTPVRAGEGHLRDLHRIHAPRRQQDHLGPPPLLWA